MSLQNPDLISTRVLDAQWKRSQSETKRLRMPELQSPGWSWNKTSEHQLRERSAKLDMQCVEFPSA
jgi:hypothetical protein